MPNSSRRSFVMLEYTTQSRMADDLFISCWWIIVIRPDTQERLVVLPLMKASLAAETHVLANDIIEVPEPKCNEPIQAPVPSTSLLSESNHDFAERLSGALAVHFLCWLLALAFPQHPPLVSSGVYDHD